MVDGPNPSAVTISSLRIGGSDSTPRMYIVFVKLPASGSPTNSDTMMVNGSTCATSVAPSALPRLRSRSGP